VSYRRSGTATRAADAVIDTEAVDVLPVMEASPSPELPPTGDSSEAAASNAGSDAGADASAASAAAADEALREYRELEALLSGAAVSTSGASATAGGTTPAAIGKDGRSEDPWEPRSGVAAASHARKNDDKPVTDVAATAGGATGVAASKQRQGPAAEQQAGRKEDEAERQADGAVKAKPGSEVAREILSKRGPTDAAIAEALAALDPRGEEELLDEFYAIFGGG
ncbi:hypothetical protein Agub_g11892, partial [Astrephomene gubernaculifera]